MPRSRRRSSRSGDARPGEFELIARYLAPLAKGYPLAFGLKDDIGLIETKGAARLVAKTDALVAGRHFLPSDPADLVARKLLRVNLSDLAAKGATPLVYLLDLCLPDDFTAAWIGAFAQGLGEDQKRYGLHLIGGDTVATPGPATLAVTLIGQVPKRPPIRAGAKEGDDIWVTGTIGDGVLGLLVSTGRLTLGAEAAAHLVGRYRLPEPRLAAGKGIAALAHASMDISDGLVGDLGHIAEESRLKAEIIAAAVPVSAAATEALAEAPELLSEMLSGGDDYEILFTASPRSAPAIARIARRAGTPITRIGRMKRGRGVTVLDRRGRPLDFERTGYRHF